MSTIKRELKLWGFLHAFQQSPYKYLYMNQMLEALEQIEIPDRDLLIDKLREINPPYEYWLDKLIPISDLIADSEEMHLQSDYRFVFYGDRDFPLALRNMSDPPLALSYQGNLQGLYPEYMVSVVGSREPHDFSKEWMQSELYTFLKTHRPSVVSGGARGIDQKAHLMATLLDLPTVVMLPSGLSNKYPALWNESHWKNKSVIFVSEMLLGEKISKKNFSSRNRLIAAWGLVTIIVEAHKRSGTLITAHHAMAEGRAVWVVPGHPMMPSFAGSLELTLINAQIVRNASDLSSLFEGQTKYYAAHPLGLVYGRQELV